MLKVSIILSIFDGVNIDSIIDRVLSPDRRERYFQVDSNLNAIELKLEYFEK